MSVLVFVFEPSIDLITMVGFRVSNSLPSSCASLISARSQRGSKYKKKQDKYKKTINPLEVNANIKKSIKTNIKKVLQASFPLEIKGIALLYQIPANRSSVNGKKIKIYLTMRKFQCIYPHLVLWRSCRRTNVATGNTGTNLTLQNQDKQNCLQSKFLELRRWCWFFLLQNALLSYKKINNNWMLSSPSSW